MRWVIGAFASLAVVLATAVPVAWAVDLFGDVPSDNPFHDDINAIARAGITTGCAPGAYCPGDNVSRQAMAAFMHRGFGRVAQATDGVGPVGTDGAVLVSTTLTPGLPANAVAGSAAFIKVDASVNVVATDTSGCPCVFSVGAFDQTTGTLIQDFSVSGTFSSSVGEMTVPLNVAYTITGSAPRTIDVVGLIVAGTGTADVFSSVTASYFPFGATGTNTLGASASQATAGRDRSDRVERRYRELQRS
jgi:hypothetical protein